MEIAVTDEPTMRVKFLRTRDFTPEGAPQLTLALAEGAEDTIRRVWGEALVAAGDAVEVAAPKRKAKGGLGDWDGDGEPGGDAAARPPASEAVGASAGAAIQAEPQP